MIDPQPTATDLRAWIAEGAEGPLNGFSEAIDDDSFLRAIRADTILDVRLSGEPGRPFLPSAETLFFSEESSSFEKPPERDRVDLVVLPGVLQRTGNPFRLLRAIYPLLRPGGTLLVSTPLREVFHSGRELGPHEQLNLQKRFYTIAGLFFDVQAAWGFNAFRIRFAREYDGLASGRPLDSCAFSLVVVIEKRAERSAHPEAPMLQVKRAPDIVNRSEEERLLSIDLTEVLAPSLTSADIKRVCILKLDHIGDFIMSLPVFDEVRALFPQAEITCVCGSWNVSLARDLGCFDRIVPCDYYAHNGPNSPALSALATQRLGEQLADGDFDLAIDFRVPPDSREIIQVVPARCRAAIGSSEAFPFLDVALPAFDAFNVRLEPDPEASHMFLAAESFSCRGAVASPPSFRLLRPEGEAREIIWGPYVALRRGAYRATWMLSSGDDPLSVEVDVSVHDPSQDRVNVLRSATINIDNAGPTESVEFELYADMSGLEFRARVPAGQERSSLIFTGVQLERISGRASSRQMAQGQVHMKEQMSLLLALVRSRLFAPVRSTADLRRRLKVATGAPATPFFALVPYSNSELRNWPTANFTALARLILKESSASVRLIGSAGQRAELDAVAGEIAGAGNAGRIENHAGAPWASIYTSLVQAEAVVSNNSGMAHMAAVLGAKVVALYSASHQVLEWGPIGPSVTTLQASLPCGACAYDTMPECLHGHRCMQLIEPRSVLSVLRRLSPKTFSAAGGADSGEVSRPAETGLGGRLVAAWRRLLPLRS